MMSLEEPTSALRLEPFFSGKFALALCPRQNGVSNNLVSNVCSRHSSAVLGIIVAYLDRVQVANTAAFAGAATSLRVHHEHGQRPRSCRSREFRFRSTAWSLLNLAPNSGVTAHARFHEGEPVPT